MQEKKIPTRGNIAKQNTIQRICKVKKKKKKKKKEKKTLNLKF